MSGFRELNKTTDTPSDKIPEIHKHHLWWIYAWDGECIYIATYIHASIYIFTYIYTDIETNRNIHSYSGFMRLEAPNWLVKKKPKNKTNTKTKQIPHSYEHFKL